MAAAASAACRPRAVRLSSLWAAWRAAPPPGAAPLGRGFAAGALGLPEKRRAQREKLEALPEVRRCREFRDELRAGAAGLAPGHRGGRPGGTFEAAGLGRGDVRLALEAGLATFLLHVQARVANHCGEGFYTIGPCGEELLAGVGLALEQGDASALHYRHLSTSLARALKAAKPMDQVLLDRARGFCVSALDPVGGGHHCLLGGGEQEFLVTSTLASQATPAVGRAAGLRLARHLGLENPRLPARAVSYVSVGDGSINNAHFLSAVNLAEYMQHRGFQCPVVFGISDNGLCISLRGHGWVDKFAEQRLGMPVFRADGNDLADVYRATLAATDLARRKRAPATIIFQGLARRFGHAATDRQDAYLSAAEIEHAEASSALAAECARAVEQGLTTYPELSMCFDELEALVEASFDAAAAEPKLASRAACVSLNSQALVPKAAVVEEARVRTARAQEEAGAGAPQVMRRSMTRAFDQVMRERKELVYIGEDVQHGGYYRVTEGLHEKHGFRVADFPPDETSLLGVALGYSQAGLLPIVEIPYAKYLDCGGDMFSEAVIMNWLSAGKSPSGMIIRLQGFDKGVFGGNFHTHNVLPLPPGLDVVAYSNGADYARGLRNAVAQATAGRVVMLVDSTDLLNRRHLFDRDNGWMTAYPPDPCDVLAFDEVRTHGEGERLLIVTYGNGVPTALLARKTLKEQYGLSGVVVADAPYLSDVPEKLTQLLPRFSAVLFADVCKLGQHPHAGFVVKLQDRGLLPSRWRSVAAVPTYNPLGTTFTFLSEMDVVEGALAAVG